MTAVEVAFQLGRVMGNWLVEKGKVEDWLIICIYIYMIMYTRIYIYTYIYLRISQNDGHHKKYFECLKS